VNELGEELRKLILKVYSIYLSADGRKVDYDGISRSSEFKLYQKLALQLHRVEVETASREEKLAFFINVYNALVVHANVVKGPPTNMWQRYKVCAACILVYMLLYITLYYTILIYITQY